MKFFKNLLYLLLSDATAKIINFAVLAYLARVLLPQGLGLFNWIQSIVVLVAIVPNFGLNEYGILSIAKNVKKETIEFTVNAILGFRIVVGSIVIICFLLVVSILAQVQELALYFILASFLIVASILSFDWFYTSIEDQVVPGIVRIVSKIFYLLAVLLFVQQKEDLHKAILIFSSSEIILSGGLLLYYRLHLQYRIAPIFKGLKSLILETFPLALYTANSVIVTSIDIVIIGIFLSMDQVGLYSGALKIISLFVSVKYLLGQLIYPKLVKNVATSKESLTTVLRIINKYSIVGGFLLVTILFLLSPLIVGIVLGGQFIESVVLFRILLISLFAEFAWIAYPYLVISHNKNIYSIIMIVMGILKIIFIFTALQLGGLLLCAMTYSAVSVLLFAVCIAYSNRRILSQSFLKILLIPLCGIIILISSAYYLHQSLDYLIYILPVLIIASIIYSNGETFKLSTMKTDIKFINAA